MLEKLPIGTRVIYSPPAVAGLEDIDGAIRAALENPTDMDPLRALVSPGSKVTIAIDDNAIVVPLMKRPDHKQRVLEAVLEILAACGVDDIHIIIAVGLHRGMRDAEIARMLGSKSFEAFAPDRFYNHDAAAPDGNVELGKTEAGHPVTLPRRAAESDLLIYINTTMVSLCGGHKSVAVGLGSYESIRAHHHPSVMGVTESLMQPKRSCMHDQINAIGRVIGKNVPVFQIEVALNNRLFGASLDFLLKNEDQFSTVDWLRFKSAKFALDRSPEALRREIFGRVRGPHDATAVNAGAVESVHARTLKKMFEQLTVPVDGQSDIVIIGISGLAPYNVASIQNPVIVRAMALSYMFHQHFGDPPLKKGGTLIICNPLRREFDAATHPSYVPFYEELLLETRDAQVLADKYEPEYAANPEWIDAYRHRYAYHPAHPFFLWSWGEQARRWCGRIIGAGATDRRVTERIGWEHAATLAEAIAMAKSDNADATLSLLRVPPTMMCDVS